MEYAISAASATISPKNDEFLKIFLALLIADGGVGLIQSVMRWSSRGAAPMTALFIVAGILSFAMFVLGIILWVRSVKRKYPKFIMWTAITRIFLPIVVGIIGAAIGLILTFGTLNEAAIQAPSQDFAMPAELVDQLNWLVLLPAINGLVFIGLGISALVKIRKL